MLKGEEKDLNEQEMFRVWKCFQYIGNMYLMV